MKNKSFFIITLSLVFIASFVSSVQVCETYDDFESGILNTSKWEIKQDVEGQPLMDEYGVLEENGEFVFHTQQNIAEDRRIYLFPKRQFTTGDVLKYDVGIISKEDNYGNMVLLTGDQYIRIGIMGYSGGVQGFDELGTAHIELEFEENNLIVRRHSPSGTDLLDNLALSNSNGTYEFYVGSFSGHNGIVHMDYNNFII